MTNTNPLATLDVSLARVRTLRDDAKIAGDAVLADMCEIMIAGVDSDGTGTTLGTPCSLAQAITEVVHALAEVAR